MQFYFSVHSFLLLSIPIVWIYHNLFINSSISDLPGVSSLRLTNKAAMNTKVILLGGDIFCMNKQRYMVSVCLIL